MKTNASTDSSIETGCEAVLDNTVKLSDGRKLGFARYGDFSGTPIIFFHGWPGSRLFIRPTDAMSRNLCAHVIAVDRPGIGLSDFQAGRTILDWPDDVAQLADALGIKDFAVAGHSGGGPYALACAYKIPSRITRVALISAVAPLDKPGATRGMKPLTRLLFKLSRRSKLLHRLVIHLMTCNSPQRVFKIMYSMLPPEDKKVYDSFGNNIEDIAESFRQGADGFMWDQVALAQPWGFSPGDIKTRVLLWHGDRDKSVPVSMARQYAAELHNCRPTICEGLGHLLIFPLWEEIVRGMQSCNY